MNEDKKTAIVFYKNKGKFYNYVGIDSYIMFHLFGYKVLKNNKGGFPDVAFNRVVNTLEDKKINYQIIYQDKDPVKKDFKKLNNYEKYLNIALDNMELTKKVDLILEKLKNASMEQLENTLKVLEECLK